MGQRNTGERVEVEEEREIEEGELRWILTGRRGTGSEEDQGGRNWNVDAEEGIEDEDGDDGEYGQEGSSGAGT